MLLYNFVHVIFIINIAQRYHKYNKAFHNSRIVMFQQI